MAKPTKMPRTMLDRLERIREKRSMREKDAQAAQARAERMRLAAQSRVEAPDKAHADAGVAGRGEQASMPQRSGVAGRLALGALAMGLFMDRPSGIGLVRETEPEPPVGPDLE